MKLLTSSKPVEMMKEANVTCDTTDRFRAKSKTVIRYEHELYRMMRDYAWVWPRHEPSSRLMAQLSSLSIMSTGMKTIFARALMIFVNGGVV